jgi:hypothetical protein
MASSTLHSDLAISRNSSGQREEAARAALNSCTGRVLSDRDWARARVRLLEFVTILRAWEEKAKTPESGLGNVV